MAVARDHHVTFVAETEAGNFLYVAYGAAEGGAPREIERATIGADGGLSAFETIAEVPKARIGPGFGQLGASFVVVGGLTASSNSSESTYFGVVNPEGKLEFAEGSDLVNSRYHGAVVIVQGHAYVIGGLFQNVGMMQQDVLASVERASFDGATLGAWSPATDLPEPLTHVAAVATEDAIFVIGGGSALPARTQILRTEVAANGDLSAWEVVGELPEGRATSSALLFLDQLYVIAGMAELTGDERGTVLRADLGMDGKLQAFSELPALPLARAHSHQTPRFQNKLYSVGGSINHEHQAQVFIGTLE